MSIKKLTSSLLLGAAAWTFVCPPSPFADRLQAQTVEGFDERILESDFAAAADFYAAQQWEQAADAFKSYINKRGPKRQVAAAKFFLGECYIQQNDFESAYRWYESFVRENPLNEFTARATFRMGESAWRTGQAETALRVLEKFTQVYPSHRLVEFALPYLGKMRLQRSEPQLAKSAFAMALKLFPNSSMTLESRIGLGQANEALGDLESATENYSIVAATNQQAQPLIVGQAKRKLGELAFGKKDYTQAVSLLSDAIKTCSGEAKIQCGYWLALAEIRAENYEAAVELVSTLVAAFAKAPMPSDTGGRLLFDGAIAASKIDRDELACIWLGKLQTLYPNNPLAKQAFDLEMRTHMQARRFERVIAMYENMRAQSQASANVNAAIEMAGRAFYSVGDYAKTVETFQHLVNSTASLSDGDVASEPDDKRANWLYLKSLGHIGLKQYDEALENLESADALNQTQSMSALIALARGTSHFGKKEPALAIEHYHAYLENSTTGADASRAGCELALCFAELKQWDDALETFAIMQKFDADERVTKTTRHLADQAYDADEKEVAKTFYLSMTDPSNPPTVIQDGLSGLAWVYMESTDHAEALAVFRRLTRDVPKNEFARDAAMSRARFLDAAGFESEASAMYSLVIDRFGSSASAKAGRLRKVALLQKMGGRANLEAARDMLKEQLQTGTSPDDETLYQLGWVLMDLGKSADGMERFSRLVQQHPTSQYWPDAALRIASQQIKDGEIEAATATADAILKKENVSDQIAIRTMLLKGQLAAGAGQWPEVTRLMQQVKEKYSLGVSLAPPSAIFSKATYWLAESLYQQQQYEESIQEFSQIQDDATVETKLQPWVQLRRAQCFCKLQRWDEATRVAEEGFAKFSDFPQAHEFAFVEARALEARGILDDAQTLYREVIESDDGRRSETAAIAQWRIGEINFHREDFPVAIDAYQKVNGLYRFAKWKKAAMLQAGKCQEHLGNWKHASKLYSQLVSQYPDSTMAERAEERLALIEQLAQKPASPNSSINTRPKRR